MRPVTALVSSVAITGCWVEAEVEAAGEFLGR